MAPVQRNARVKREERADPIGERPQREPAAQIFRRGNGVLNSLARQFYVETQAGQLTVPWNDLGNRINDNHCGWGGPEFKAALDKAWANLRKEYANELFETFRLKHPHEKINWGQFGKIESEYFKWRDVLFSPLADGPCDPDYYPTQEFERRWEQSQDYADFKREMQESARKNFEDAQARAEAGIRRTNAKGKILREVWIEQIDYFQQCYLDGSKSSRPLQQGKVHHQWKRVVNRDTGKMCVRCKVCRIEGNAHFIDLDYETVEAADAILGKL